MKLNTASPGYVVFFAIAFSGVFTAAVVTLQVVAAPIIERNEAVRDERALVKVFELHEDVDALTPEEVAALVATHVQDDLVVTDPESGQTFTVYRAYDEEGGLVTCLETSCIIACWALGGLCLRP